MKRVVILILCVLALSEISCRRDILNETGLPHIDAEVLYRGTQCNGPEKGPSAEWVIDDAHLSAVYSRLHRHIISPKVISPPEVDFSDFVLLLVYMGSVPSSRYSIDIARDTVPVVSGTAELDIIWRVPDLGSIQSQVIGSPCIMIKLPKTGYTAVSLADQDNRILLKLGLTVE